MASEYLIASTWLTTACNFGPPSKETLNSHSGLEITGGPGGQKPLTLASGPVLSCAWGAWCLLFLSFFFFCCFCFWCTLFSKYTSSVWFWQQPPPPPLPQRCRTWFSWLILPELHIHPPQPPANFMIVYWRPAFFHQRLPQC